MKNNLNKKLIERYSRQIVLKNVGVTGQKNICRKHKGDNPITLKLLKKNLNWNLIFNTDLKFQISYWDIIKMICLIIFL